MEMSEKALNVTQLLINSLKEGVNLSRHYIFTPEEAKHILRVLDLFSDTRYRYINVSFFYNPDQDKSVSLKVFKKPFGQSYDLINYNDNRVRDFLSNHVKVDRTPQKLKMLAVANFL